MSSEQIRLQVLPNLFLVNNWIAHCTDSVSQTVGPATENAQVPKVLRQTTSAWWQRYEVWTTWVRLLCNSGSLEVKLTTYELQVQCTYSLASCLIYARALLEYVIIINWLRSVIEMLPSVKFAEDKMLTFFILREKC